MAHNWTTRHASGLARMHDCIDEPWTQRWERQMSAEERIMQMVAQLINDMHKMRMEIERLRRLLNEQQPTIINNSVRVDI